MGTLLPAGSGVIAGGQDEGRLDGTALEVAAGEQLEGLIGWLLSVMAAGSSGGGGKIPTNMLTAGSCCGLVWP